MKTEASRQALSQSLFKKLLPFAAMIIKNITKLSSPPHACKGAGKNYVLDSDAYMKWFTETFEESDDNAELVPAASFYDFYRHNHNFTSKQDGPSKSEFLEEIAKLATKDISLRRFIKTRSDTVDVQSQKGLGMVKKRLGSIHFQYLKLQV